MSDYLIETALLAHGLVSLSNNELADGWTLPDARLVWLEQGHVRIGALADFLPLRQNGGLTRIRRAQLPAAREGGLTAALTASAAMAVCAELGIIPVAVTCGMGGVARRPTVTVSDDLPALAELPVILVASAPKDVFDLPATVDWLRSRGVSVRGWQGKYCDGFLSHGVRVALDSYAASPQPPLLILNPLAEEERVVDAAQLAEAMRRGEDAAARGKEYHPAVNNALAELSNGVSTVAQLSGLLANAILAGRLQSTALGGKK